MTRILILGGGGMLGHKLFQRLRERFPGTRCTLRGRPREGALAKVPLFDGDDVLPNVDAMDLSKLRDLLGDERPDVLINCIGIIKQRDSAKVARPSIKINALLPHELAHWAAKWGGRVIHFSTDCVFAGYKTSPYAEDDPSDAEDIYGKTKYLGEVAAENSLTLRTSIVGRELKHFRSLVEWFLAQEGRTIQGYAGHLYSGLTTNHLVDVVGDLIEHHPDLHGLYQVASTPISKYALLTELAAAKDMSITIEKDTQQVLNRCLAGERFVADTGIQTKSWAKMIAELVSDNTPYDQWR